MYFFFVFNLGQKEIYSTRNPYFVFVGLKKESRTQVQQQLLTFIIHRNHDSIVTSRFFGINDNLSQDFYNYGYVRLQSIIYTFCFFFFLFSMIYTFCFEVVIYGFWKTFSSFSGFRNIFTMINCLNDVTKFLIDYMHPAVVRNLNLRSRCT